MFRNSFRRVINTTGNYNGILKNAERINKLNNNNFNKISSRNFSIKSIKDDSDLFLHNISIDNSPKNIMNYNDIDFTMTTEIFKDIDMDNPYVVGRFSRLFCLTEDVLHNVSMFLSHDMGLGLGISTILISIGLRMSFAKFNIRNAKNAKINRLVYVEKKDMNAKIKQIKNGPLQFIERRKMTLLDEKFGIRNNPVTHIMSFFQMFCTFTYTSLIQRFCYHVEDYPEMTYGGFLWFKDLSVIDPYYILPLAQTNTMSYSSNTGISLRRFFYLVPIFSLPIMVTFESGMILYFCCAQFNIIAFNIFLNSSYGRRLLNIPTSLPGSVFEKMGEIAQVRKLEANKYDEELKMDDKKDKLYESKLKNLNKETLSYANKNVVINPKNK